MNRPDRDRRGVGSMILRRALVPVLVALLVFAVPLLILLQPTGRIATGRSSAGYALAAGAVVALAVALLVATGLAARALARVAEGLDHGAASVQRRLDRQRGFVADVSHQLRTPLAAIRLRLENMALAGGDPDGRIAATMDEVDRLATIINDLLELARADEAPTAREVVDVAAVLRERVAVSWTPLADAAGVVLWASAPDHALARSVPGGAQQVLDNLFANALQASPSGSRVDLEVRAGWAAVTVRVADRGPGMTEAERVHAFVRFWRGTARTQGGSGLGLPIAARLVEASGGTIALLPREGGGLVAEVRLPAAAAAASGGSEGGVG